MVLFERRAAVVGSFAHFAGLTPENGFVRQFSRVEPVSWVRSSTFSRPFWTGRPPLQQEPGSFVKFSRLSFLDRLSLWQGLGSFARFTPPSKKISGKDIRRAGASMNASVRCCVSVRERDRSPPRTPLGHRIVKDLYVYNTPL